MIQKVGKDDSIIMVDILPPSQGLAQASEEKEEKQERGEKVRPSPGRAAVAEESLVSSE